MDAADRARVEELRRQVNCEKGCRCVYLQVEALCKVDYDAGTGRLECREQSPAACQFAEACGEVYLCGCLLRKFIVSHFDEWAGHNIDLLRSAPGSGGQ